MYRYSVGWNALRTPMMARSSPSVEQNHISTICAALMETKDVS